MSSYTLTIIPVTHLFYNLIRSWYGQHKWYVKKNIQPDTWESFLELLLNIITLESSHCCRSCCSHIRYLSLSLVTVDGLTSVACHRHSLLSMVSHRRLSPSMVSHPRSPPSMVSHRHSPSQPLSYEFFLMQMNRCSALLSSFKS